MKPARSPIRGCGLFPGGTALVKKWRFLWVRL